MYLLQVVMLKHVQDITLKQWGVLLMLHPPEVKHKVGLSLKNVSRIHVMLLGKEQKMYLEVVNMLQDQKNMVVQIIVIHKMCQPQEK